MTVTTERGHIELANSRWTQVFRDQPRLRALLAAFVAEVQELEESAESQRLLRRLDNAVGAQLDNYGRLLGQERLGMDDDAYRALLKIRIYANRAHGTGDNVNHVLMSALGKSFGFEVDEYPPAAMVVQLLDALDLDAKVVARLVERVRMGGVNTQVVWSPDPPEEVFTLADDDTPQFSENLGLAGDGENLLPNAGFEDGDTAWTKGDTWSIAEDANARTGSWVAIKAVAPGNRSSLNSASVPCTPGDTFSASCWAKSADDGVDEALMSLQFFDSGMAFLGSVLGPEAGLVSSYRKLIVEGTAPSGSAWVQVFIRPPGPNTEGIYVDDVELLLVGDDIGGTLADVEQS